MAKFKVGDIVVGNARADKNYGITTKGWRGEVEAIQADEIHFSVQGLDESSRGTFRRLNMDYFDLESAANADNLPIF